MEPTKASSHNSVEESPRLTSCRVHIAMDGSLGHQQPQPLKRDCVVANA